MDRQTDRQVGEMRQNFNGYKLFTLGTQLIYRVTLQPEACTLKLLVAVIVTVSY
jgi:hypothetical protein